jgi:hypothetical protein
MFLTRLPFTIVAATFACVVSGAGAARAQTATDPTVAEVLGRFRDQFGQRTMTFVGQDTPRSITVPQPLRVKSYRRTLFIFWNDPSLDENTANARGITPSVEDRRRVPRNGTRLAMRQVITGSPNGLLVTEYGQSPPDTAADLELFPTVTGSADDFTFAEGDPTVTASAQETCRTFQKGGREFLLCRVILNGPTETPGFNYQVLERMDIDGN